LAFRLLESREDAEDATQDIFLNVYKSLKSFNIEARFYSWLYTIAVNRLKSLLRKRRRQVVSIEAEQIPEPVDQRVDLQHFVISANEEERAKSLLADLKPAYRIAFVLRFIEGFSLMEISNMLKIPVGTVKTHLHRARKQLLSMLTKE
jgi:RNA polymerase sigma-70 factor (ECF subfamily)